VAKISMQGHLVLTAQGKSLALWTLDGDNFREICRCVGHKGPVRTCFLSGDATVAVSGADDNHVKLWNMADGSCTHTFSGHSRAVTAVAISPK